MEPRPAAAAAALLRPLGTARLQACRGAGGGVACCTRCLGAALSDPCSEAAMERRVCVRRGVGGLLQTLQAMQTWLHVVRWLNGGLRSPASLRCQVSLALLGTSNKIRSQQPLHPFRPRRTHLSHRIAVLRSSSAALLPGCCCRKVLPSPCAPPPAPANRPDLSQGIHTRRLTQRRAQQRAARPPRRLQQRVALCRLRRPRPRPMSRRQWQVRSSWPRSGW